MAEKKQAASGWPITKGEFNSGDANSCVAVVTMGSHLDEKGLCDAGAAICGSCMTENLGIEKVIVNVISDPNIRFILTCGTEVKGHLAGQTFKALHANGVKEGRVVKAQGAIPFIENLKDDAIKRFQEQVKIVDIMETEDNAAIKAKISELKAQDPGAFPADPMVIQVKEAGGAGRGCSSRGEPAVPRDREKARCYREEGRVHRCRGRAARWQEDRSRHWDTLWTCGRIGDILPTEHPAVHLSVRR